MVAEREASGGAQHPALGCRCISHPRCEPAGQEEQTRQERKSGALSPPKRGMGSHGSRNPLTPPQWQLNARKTVGTVRSQALCLSLSFTNHATPSCSLYFSTCCGLGVSLLLVAVTQAQEDFDDRVVWSSVSHTKSPSGSAGLHPGSLGYALF